MPDETSTDKPLSELAAAERQINPPTVGKEPLPFDEIKPGMAPPRDEPMPAADRLRAFEDEKVGADAPRFNGALERGVGSLWHRMPDTDKAMHAKLEKLVEAESKLAAAHTALIAADVEHDAALAAVENHDG